MSASTSIRIQAGCRWNHTGFPLAAGGRYRIEVPPDQSWKDWGLVFGPEGGIRGLQHLAAAWLRFKGDASGKAEFFTLIGTIGESLDRAFVIGKGPREFTAPMSGELVCFANDVWAAYWNNTGSMTFAITEIP